MKSAQRPMWFMLVAVLALLWNLFGLYSFYVHVSATPEVIATWPEVQQQIAAVTPGWIFVPFAIATIGGTLGSLGLSLGKRWAVPVLLLSLLGMLDHGWSGEYWLLEHAVHRLNPRQRADLNRQYIGFVFQQYHLIDDLTVAENLEAPLSYRNYSRQERQAMVADTLDRFQIVGKKDLFPNQLSGGQQQLVGVARGLLESGALPHLAGRVVLMAVQAEEYVELERRLALRTEGRIEFLSG